MTENISKLFPTIGLIVFLGTLIFFLTISLVLNYHWGKHGAGLHGLRSAKITYFGVSSILFTIMAILLFFLGK